MFTDLMHDPDVNNPNPMLIFDFMTIYMKNLNLKVLGKRRGMQRISGVYKLDIEVIKEMGQVLDYIIGQNG